MSEIKNNTEVSEKPFFTEKEREEIKRMISLNESTALMHANEDLFRRITCSIDKLLGGDLSTEDKEELRKISHDFQECRRKKFEILNKTGAYTLSAAIHTVYEFGESIKELFNELRDLDARVAKLEVKQKKADMDFFDSLPEDESQYMDRFNKLVQKLGPYRDEFEMINVNNNIVSVKKWCSLMEDFLKSKGVDVE